MKSKFLIIPAARLSSSKAFAAILTSFRPHQRRKAEFANIAEGQAENGRKSYLPDVAIASRYSLVILGSSQNNVTPSAANTDIPLGVSTDSADSANLDVPVSVAVLGAARGTQKVLLSATVAAGDMLQSNGDGGAIKLLTTTGTFYNIGRALMSGVSGDTIEFAPSFPLKVVNA